MDKLFEALDVLWRWFVILGNAVSSVGHEAVAIGRWLIYAEQPNHAIDNSTATDARVIPEQQAALGIKKKVSKNSDASKRNSGGNNSTKSSESSARDSLNSVFDSSTSAQNSKNRVRLSKSALNSPDSTSSNSIQSSTSSLRNRLVTSPRTLIESSSVKEEIRDKVYSVDDDSTSEPSTDDEMEHSDEMICHWGPPKPTATTCDASTQGRQNPKCLIIRRNLVEEGEG